MLQAPVLLSEACTLYLWSRHADGTTPQRAVEKWNAAYPAEQVTQEEADMFIADMKLRIEDGEPAYRARHYILHPEDIPDNNKTDRSLLPHWLRLKRSKG